MKVIVFNGKGGCGKTTAQNFIKQWGKQYYHLFHFTSIIDYVKNHAKIFGWDNDKSEKGRKFLCDLKNVLSEYNDIPFQTILKDIELKESQNYELYFVDMRQADDIERLKNECNCEVITILVDRKTNIERYGNPADDNVLDYCYDYIIDNNGAMEELRYSAISLIKEILNEKI